MERQYIGARYVPAFFENPSTGDATWMSGVAYEALTIVTYAGNSYTSKKPVPAGIGSPNANPEYWVTTGNYNAQIQEMAETLRNEMGQLETETDEKLDTKQVNFSERKFIFVGDSYAKVTPSNWIDAFVNSLGIASSNYHDMSISGTGFTSSSGGGSTNGFLTQLENAVSAGYNEEDITDIVVAGGINDSTFETGTSALSTLVPAINSFCTYAHTNFPKAKIWIAYVGFASDTSSVLSNRNISRRHIAQWAYTMTNPGTNIEVAINVDAWKVIAQHPSLMSNDLLHPTSAGCSELGIQLAHWISGGKIYVHRPESTSNPFVITAQNDGIHINLVAGPPQLEAEIPAEGTGYLLNSDMPFFINKTFYAFGNIQTGGAGSYAVYQLKYTFQNRTVKISPQFMTSNGWQPLPSGRKYLLDFNVTIPWEYIG